MPLVHIKRICMFLHLHIHTVGFCAVPEWCPNVLLDTATDRIAINRLWLCSGYHSGMAEWSTVCICEHKNMQILFTCTRGIRPGTWKIFIHTGTFATLGAVWITLKTNPCPHRQNKNPNKII